ncbi:hypothetical protein T440DRAFT_479136 [Plenodomus tracheiphilus IPT5]|uniref:DUF6697 domain-containing protein n=1 Tax=Plenodomus tracheiphilus IPT5 TaxID=1408161 RepID=A0A6A7B4S8_9PLEO|nr:hypothetical protein T440DRAFT_479136 [Plenodomus tracheiphilus IPT5]
MPFSPNAPIFSPGGNNGTQQKSNAANQVSTPPSPYLEARMSNLKENNADMRGDIRSLEELYEKLTLSMDKMKKGGWPVQVGSFKEVDLSESHQKAMDFKAELEKLEAEVHSSVHSDANVGKESGTVTVNVNGSLPPHLRASSVVSNGTAIKSIPPHLRGTKKVDVGNGVGLKQSTKAPLDGALITDGHVDGQLIPAPAPSPPATPKATANDTMPTMEPLCLERTWKPHYISTLPDLSDEILCNIPADGMVTFHPEFIRDFLKGESWSPGLRFISGKGPYVLRNRTYYVLDPKTEPFLPSAPGKHGAKLTAFFKDSPETFYPNMEEDAPSYDNVPMFIEVKDAKGRFRYVYYGNYTQTRWSDKLDYDTMITKVPEDVKKFWAEELTSTAREAWVTQELKNHFYPKPEYTGTLYPAHTEDDESSVASDVEVQHNVDMAGDVRNYVDKLRSWDRVAEMKTAMMTKQMILDAFHASDMDEPPSLRLWWEYLECVDWRKDFYKLLVELQSREKVFTK